MSNQVPLLRFGNGNLVLSKYAEDDGVSLVVSGSPKPFPIGSIKEIITEEEQKALQPLLMLKFQNVQSLEAMIRALTKLGESEFFNEALEND